MKFMEIEVIEELLTRSRPQKCLEWGAGYGTIYFPEFLSGGATWLAVEHDARWAERIGALNARPNVRVHHVAPDHRPWTDEHGDGAYSDLAGYVDYPAAFGPFDFVLVDGRARASCLHKALELVTPSGLVCLHDAQRPYYGSATLDYGHQVRFHFHDRRARGRRARALWIGSTGVPIGTVLNLAHHRRVWRLYDALGTVMKVL
jgi:predicted O-methyltransferase YrrM